MISDQEMLIRNKITGVLLRQARLHAGKGVDECAAALSQDPPFIERAEEGREALTLPQLETLAWVLDVPIQYLFGEQELPVHQAAHDPAYYTDRMTLRRKIVGVILQQTRTEAGRTLQEVAAALGWQPERLRHVEWGNEPVSFAELVVLAGTLGISLGAFVDQGESPSPSQERQAAQQEELPQAETPHLAHLPADLQEFIAQPINAPYLQVALNLSQMPAEILRQLASGLFEITY
jgi:transcriptional regulator with XRE-family HTH domain